VFYEQPVKISAAKQVDSCFYFGNIQAFGVGIQLAGKYGSAGHICECERSFYIAYGDEINTRIWENLRSGGRF
jgi:hypothetical protein